MEIQAFKCERGENCMNNIKFQTKRLEYTPDVL